MQELREELFDADVARSMRFDSLVTPMQKHAAREQLLLRAAEQAMLSSLALPESRSPLRDHAYTLGQHTLRFLNLLLIDSSIYERARRPPRLYQYYNAHGRYAFSIIHMSA